MKVEIIFTMFICGTFAHLRNISTNFLYRPTIQFEQKTCNVLEYRIEYISYLLAPQYQCLILGVKINIKTVNIYRLKNLKVQTKEIILNLKIKISLICLFFSSVIVSRFIIFLGYLNLCKKILSPNNGCSAPRIRCQNETLKKFFVLFFMKIKQEVKSCY